MRESPYATAGLPRRGFALPRNDRVWWAGLFRPTLGIPQLHAVIASPLGAWQSSRGRYAGCPGDAGVALRVSWIAASG